MMPQFRTVRIRKKGASYENKRVVFAILILFVALIALLGFKGFTGFFVNDTITVNITIAEFSQISVLPVTVNFANLLPGGLGSVVNFSIKNTGSKNVSAIHVFSSTIDDEVTNPLLSGSASNYASTGFILLKNSSASHHFHVGRLEWNLSALLQGEYLALDSGTTRFGHGFYRNATHGDYLWKTENGSGGYCNATGTTLRINFSVEGSSSGVLDEVSGSWSLFSFYTGPIIYHCVAVHGNCDKIFIYKYDKRNEFDACTVGSYFGESILVPGNEIGGTLYPAIAQGVPQGQAIIGTLTVDAT